MSCVVPKAPVMERAVQLVGCVGQAIEPWLDALGELRIRVFREYPYLYDGDLAYERDYLKRYAGSPEGLVVIAVDDAGRAVGATTGLPMKHEGEEFRSAFEQAGIDITHVFYFGESILLPAWRGRGIGKAFFDRREAHALRSGYRTTTFCAVDRPANHPMRPADYRPLDGFWESRGYRRQPELRAQFSWKETGSAEETRNTLTFWTRTWTA